jgi:hypothetical protein
MKTNLKLLLIGMMMVFFSTCQESTSTKNDKLVEFQKKAKEVLNKPTKPSKITDLLELSGARLMPELVNEPANWEKYTKNEIKAAANLGVYLADAIYQYAYDSVKLAYNSAIAGKSIAEHIGIGEDVFMDFIGDRYRNVGGQNDSLFFVLDSALIHAESSLNADERFEILSAVFIGNYIEKQYIISNIIFNYPVELPKESKLLLLREMLIVKSNSLHRLDFIIELMEKAYADIEKGELYNEIKELRNLHKANMFSEDEILKLKASDIFENEGMTKIHQQIITIRDIVVRTE